jgi:hypothetical protein
MKKAWSVAFTAVLVIGIVSLVAAQPKESGKPGVTIINILSMKATVQAVDYEKRTATLKDEEGKIVTVEVGEEAKNFNQVAPGDVVMVEYVDSTVMFVRKANEPPSDRETELIEVGKPGQKPGGIKVRTTQTTATVQAINYERRTVTLQVPQGKPITLKVDESVEKFNQVQPGDEVVVHHTQAVAISVQKPQ